MAAPYSLDLRERVVAAVAAGMSRKRAAVPGDNYLERCASITLSGCRAGGGRV